MSQSERQVVVAEFADKKQAQHALQRIQARLDKEGAAVHQGAVVSRAQDGILEITPLADANLKSLANEAAGLAWALGSGTFKIAATAVGAGFALLMASAGRAASLAGTAAGMSGAALAGSVGRDPNQPLRKIGGQLPPGKSALVVVVDTARLPEVAAELERQPVAHIETQPEGGKPAKGAA